MSMPMEFLWKMTLKEVQNDNSQNPKDAPGRHSAENHSAGEIYRWTEIN
jgi:hypothetical protein